MKRLDGAIVRWRVSGFESSEGSSTPVRKSSCCGRGFLSVPLLPSRSVHPPLAEL